MPTTPPAPTRYPTPIDPIGGDWKLSEHFTFYEMTTTGHRTLLSSNRSAAVRYIPNLRRVCGELLEPIRAHFGNPIFVTSGFRSPTLNTRVGGSKTSQHKLGLAADFAVHNAAFEDVWRWIGWESRLPFSQVILEGWSDGAPSWIHIGLAESWPADRYNEVKTWTPESGYTTVRVNGRDLVAQDRVTRGG